jgi:hypothetical protein
MSKVKYFHEGQEVFLPPKTRGTEAFGPVPAHLRRESKPRESKPSEIHAQIAEVIDHEALGGVAHVDEIQAGLFHLFGKEYKPSPLYGHLKNACKFGFIHKLEGRLGFYSTVPIEARPVNAQSPAPSAVSVARPAPSAVSVARPVVGRTVR